MLDSLYPLIDESEEFPRHKGWPMEITGVCFPCPFQVVDESKFSPMAIRNPSKLEAEVYQPCRPLARSGTNHRLLSP
jgi:hypothetical protein